MEVVRIDIEEVDKGERRNVQVKMEGAIKVSRRVDFILSLSLLPSFTCNLILIPSFDGFHLFGRMASDCSWQVESSGVEVEFSRKLPSSKYKGVVTQPNGRWGAQIYEKHRRIWLGTFNREEEAAKAYDVAARRFRGPAALTNLKVPENGGQDEIEAIFLDSHSKAEIVDMLRKHTYTYELDQKILNHGSKETCSNAAMEPLFHKVVTPSDVGKLNRIVIPKQHAEKHLPLQLAGSSNGGLLNFEDNSGKIWRFRYSYWHSSQSYVLTKGWRRFVREKNLKAGDTVRFCRSTGSDRRLFIAWEQRERSEEETRQVVRLFGVNLVNNS